MPHLANVFEAIGVPVFFVSVWVLVFYNKYRLRRTGQAIRDFFADGALNEAQFKSLREEYNSFLGYAAWFPDEKLYRKLYDDVEFNRFRKRSKFILLTAIAAIGFSLLCLLLSTLLGQQSYG